MNFFTTTEIAENEEGNLTGKIIGAAIDVHRALGPGLLESAYEACLVYELRLRKMKVESAVSVVKNYLKIPILNFCVFL